MTEEQTASISPEAAQAALQAERSERIQRCQQKLAEVLKEHDCTVIGKALITDDGRIQSQVVVVSVK
jgi:hypothetical protein